MGKLSDALSTGRKVFTAEITPPKGCGTKKLLQHAELLKPHVDAINVTDCQRALVKMSSLAACKVLLDSGVEPVFQLTCRDRNSIAMQSDLMGAAALGLPNVLCLTGDPVKAGDCPQAKSVFEMESVRQLELVHKIQTGTDTNGNKLNRRSEFFVGAVVNPTMQSAGSQMLRMEKKVAAGAQFFQTQASYDPEDFRTFLLEVKKLQTKMLAGILVLHTAEMAHYINDNIPGISMPQTVLDEFDSASDPEAFGIEFAIRTMKTVEDCVDGFHLMTIRKEELIPKLLEQYHG